MKVYENVVKMIQPADFKFLSRLLETAPIAGLDVYKLCYEQAKDVVTLQRAVLIMQAVEIDF